MNVCSLSHVLNVYDAVILTVIAGFHSVQHKTAPSGWWAGDSQTKPTNLLSVVCRLLSSTLTITI